MTKTAEQERAPEAIMKDITETIIVEVLDDFDGPSKSHPSQARSIVAALKDAGIIQMPEELTGDMLRAAENCHGVIVDENGDYTIDIPAIYEALKAASIQQRKQ